MPVAPPVYRPEAKKPIPQTGTAQPKMAAAAPVPARPAAPPVYRPQPKPVTAPPGLPARAASASAPVQAKAAGHGPAAPQPSGARILQPRLAGANNANTPARPPAQTAVQARLGRELPARPGTQAKNIRRAPAAAIQRKILLDGQEIYWDQIMALPFAGHLDDDQKMILMNWADQRTKHKFISDSDQRRTAAAKMFEAAARVAALLPRGNTVVNLYRKENLKFITKTPDRKPTLYFISGDQSGRLRQTHGSGPMLGLEEGKTDFFYKDMADLRQFHAKMSEKRKKREATDWWEWNSEWLLHNSLTAQEGYFHLEVTRDPNGIVTNTHVSGGTYSSDISGYDDDWISRNALGVVGLVSGLPDL